MSLRLLAASLVTGAIVAPLVSAPGPATMPEPAPVAQAAAAPAAPVAPARQPAAQPAVAQLSPEDVIAALPDGVSTAEIKVELPEAGDPHEFVDRFRMSASFEGGRLTTIDGLRVDWSDGWGLVRASNTTPVLVMRFDADSNAAMARIQHVFREHLLRLEPNLRLPF